MLAARGKPLRIVGALAAALLTTAGAAAGATLDAAAGLGGLVKPGRWTPVRISIGSDEAMPPADLLVTWGDATVRRTVAFPSPGTRLFELYVRTSDAEEEIRVRLVRGGAELATKTVPVRIARDDAPVVVCVVPVDAPPVDDATCSTAVAVPALPTSPRGYEAADEVTFPVGLRRLTPVQATALQQWHILEDLDARGDLSLAPQAARPTTERGLPRAAARGLWGLAVLYLAGLIAAGFWFTREAVTTLRMTAACAGLLVAGCATVLAYGHIGPTRAVLVRHNSLLQQIPGTTAALLSMRAIAEFPARDQFTLTLPAADAVIQPSTSAGRPEERADADGSPVLSGGFGLGTRAAFAAEAVVSVALVSVVENARTLQITNRSPHALSGCVLADNYAPATIAALAAGATITAHAVREDGGADVLGPLVLCTMEAAPVPLTEPSRPVVMRGTTTIAVYRPPAPPPPPVAAEPTPEAP